jgi:3-methyl-2-oxobutanoate hydroxymethyltransferase
VQRTTAPDIRSRKGSDDKLVMVTAYDATFASILDHAGVDILLVGDSLGMVIQGLENTLPVTLEHMIYHTRAVSRGAKRAHVVGDMPFMSYQISPEQAVASAGRLVQEGGAHAVKLEGGSESAAAIARIVDAGIPVMGHIGLTPQSLHRFGGFKVQGRDLDTARKLVADAQELCEAGCYSLVLEGIPLELAAQITACVPIPTIGIGAGAACDGQVLVCYDMLGMNPDFKPKFVKTYENLHERIVHAAETFIAEVKSGAFPQDEHTFHSPKLRVATPPTKPKTPDNVAELYPEEPTGGLYSVPC